MFYFKIFWSHTSVFWSTQCRGYFKVKLSLEVNSEPSQTSKMGLFLKIVTSLINVEKMQFSLEDVGNWTDTQFPADFFTFTEQIFKWKISFSCWTTSLNVNGVSSFCFNDGFACLCCKNIQCLMYIIFMNNFECLNLLGRFISRTLETKSA